MNRWITSAIVSCVRLLPTVLAGSPEGCNALGLLGIFSTNLFVRLGKSPNRLRYFPLVGNIRSCASIKSVVYCRTVCLVLCETMFSF